ncbi:hypothetical protein [Amphritea balenae]|uniref:Sodium:solute symporter n=1 Tax=Amphritea balenae TaxID=452629 RepID=A0A3P1STT1_9GAMM|nr:hypothetical protein [Amphritea balenae]RRD00490.1 hypothetical protein EHS89_05195 [Amphritea balenae]GGK70317.1 hypothetical protein GCM10007941_20710 [Amphritea balenae]
MFSLFSVFLAICLYMALLFALATGAERHHKKLQPHYLWIYALAMGVFHTSWGFYGNIGYAASHGFMFILLDLGSYLCIALWWVLLRRMVQVKEALHITSLADMIAARYNRSPAIAAAVTLIVVLGSVPYIGLQIKAVIQSVGVLTDTPLDNEHINLTGIGSSLILLLFTILYGMRRLDPTEHHYGMLVVLAVECVIKIGAMLAVGIFVSFGLYEGIGDIFNQLQNNNLEHITGLGPEHQRGSAGLGLFVIGFFSILMLPRQFHIAVVENASQKHILPASLILTLYLLLFSVFMVPIAGAGLLHGISPDQADMTMLLLPLQSNQHGLALATFIGGFAAASGMVIITTTTVSTMVTNHLILPLAERWQMLIWLRSHLLQARWAVALSVILLSYLFVTALTASYLLLSIGTLAITALLQVVPALFGGLFWRRGNGKAALWSMLAGMLVWFYTLLLPILLRQLNMAPELLESGPFAINWLHPEALFGLKDIDTTAQGLLFSLGINCLLYYLISVLTQPHKEERNLTNEFMALFDHNKERQVRPGGLDDYIPLEDKREEAVQLLSHYLRRNKALERLLQIETDLHIQTKKSINIIELVEYHRMIEHELAGSIGAASSHSAVKSHLCYSNREASELQAIYHHISHELREAGQSGSSDKDRTIDVLHSQIAELERTISTQQHEIEQLLDRLDGHYEQIHQHRLQAQQYRDSLEQLKARQTGREKNELEQENKRLKLLYAELSLKLDQLNSAPDTKPPQ